MRIVGILIMATSLFFFWGAWHAFSMYQIQGDERWFLTIGFAPIFGVVTLTLGNALRALG